MQVATESKKGQTAAISVVVNTGSGHENQTNNGIAHFLEHLAFKGTQRRTRHQLELEIENMGGSLNAFTSREHTVYIAKVFRHDVDKAVDILSDIIQHSRYDESDIQYEKGVVLREMEEVNKCVDEFAMDHLHEIAFQGSSLGYTILGPRENIQGFTRDAIVDYVNSYYTCNRMVVVGSGAVEHDALVKLTEGKFDSLRQSSPRDLDVLPQPEFIGAYRNLKADISAENYGILSYEGASWSSGQLIPLLIIQTLIGSYDKHLGGGDNLFPNLAHRVASKSESCEKVSSFITSYNSSGLVGCCFSTKSDDLRPLVRSITEEYANLAEDITPEEIDRAKHRLKVSLAMMYDGVVPVCEDIGRQLLTVGRRVSLQEYFDRIDMIDHDMIRNTCLQHFQNVSPSLVSVGPNVKELDYSEVQQMTSQ